MSKIYELKEGDDIREIRLTLTSVPEPVEAVLILSKGTIREERNLAQESDGNWTYRFVDGDFELLIPNTYKAEIYATFSDGTNGTYPTRGTMMVKVYAKL